MATGIGGRDEFIVMANIWIMSSITPESFSAESGLFSESIIYRSDIEFHKYRKTEKGEQVVGTRGRKPRNNDKNEAGEEKRKKQEAATECFLVSSGGLAFVWNENSECLRDYSGLAGLWEPSSYLYTSNMENGNHQCVCAKKCVSSIMNWWVAIQTNTQWSIKHKKEFSFDHIFTSTTSIYRWNTSKSKFFFFAQQLHFYSLVWLGHLLSFSVFSSIHSLLHSFIFPSSLPVGQKNRCHAPVVLRGGKFRFVSNFRLMSVFWLVVYRLGSVTLDARVCVRARVLGVSFSSADCSFTLSIKRVGER